MEIYIGSDHGGYELKRRIVDTLTEQGYVVKDLGTQGVDIVRYPYFAESVASAVVEAETQGLDSKGILICSTGIGMSIIANKFKGIRAALCTSSYMAKMTRAHNNSNILCLGGQITGPAEALDIVEVWLNTEFEGGRHLISLGLITEAEERLLNEHPSGESVMTKGR